MGHARRGGPRTPSTVDTNLDCLLKTHFFAPILDHEKSTEYTASDLFSGHGYSGNDGFSGTKPLDDAILFTNSGITALVELFLEKI